MKGKLVMKEAIDYYLRREELSIGQVQSFKNLSLLPIMSVRLSPFGFLSLSEGLSQGCIEIKETSQKGSVPELSAFNHSDRPLFILDGEELVGGKQNRVVNASFIIPSQTHVVLPVSCVEQRRWEYTQSQFSASDTLLSLKSRSIKNKDVTDNLKQSQSFRANQSKIWNSITEHTISMEINSITEAMNDIFRMREEDIAAYIQAFQIEPDQIGWGIFMNGELIGLDLLGHHELFIKYAKKLLKSYALDALSDYGGQDFEMIEHQEMIQKLLDTLQAIHFKSFETLGEGQDLRFEQDQLCGSMLIYQDRNVHLSAFIDPLSSDGKRGYRLWKRDKHLIDPLKPETYGTQYLAYFSVIEGENKGRSYGLSEQRTLIGRSLDSDLLLCDSHISRKHAVLSYDSVEGYSLLDLKSANGTMVNGRRISECPLKAGDVISFGKKTTFQFGLLPTSTKEAELNHSLKAEALENIKLN